jgi:hypothetical protein
MKLFSVMFVVVLIGFILGWGILLATKGSFWLLGAGLLTYLVLFAKTGCLPPKHH